MCLVVVLQWLLSWYIHADKDTLKKLKIYAIYLLQAFCVLLGVFFEFPSPCRLSTIFNHWRSLVSYIFEDFQKALIQYYNVTISAIIKFKYLPFDNFSYLYNMMHSQLFNRREIVITPHCLGRVTWLNMKSYNRLGRKGTLQ